ncbi:hypothetical protein SAMN05443550_101668 [Pedobacter hartonius]|uniref:Uncharacterized protein n=1 Tax=Pedobacter hartonius TaxID=425514 RepID=A0A1H3XNY6_9SPHI|nr:hypothetical protein SAMN05443550_101668 [Pedobacter hartonius]
MTVNGIEAGKLILNRLNPVFAFLPKMGLKFVIQGLFITFGQNQTIELCINLP